MDIVAAILSIYLLGFVVTFIATCFMIVGPISYRGVFNTALVWPITLPILIGIIRRSRP